MPKTDIELYSEYKFIQTAEVERINRIDNSTWIIDLKNVASLKGETKSIKAVTHIQNSSCGISIEKGQTWVFFYSSLDSIGQIELGYCNPSRNSSMFPFDTGYMFNNSVFSYKTLPENVFESYKERIDSILNFSFNENQADSLTDTSIHLLLQISKEGKLKIVNLTEALLMSDPDLLTKPNYFKVDKCEKVDRLIAKLEQDNWPILECYGHNLNVEVYWLYPRKPK